MSGIEDHPFVQALQQHVTDERERLGITRWRVFSDDELRTITHAFSAAQQESSFGCCEPDNHLARDLATTLKTRGIDAEWAHGQGTSPPDVWLKVMVDG